METKAIQEQFWKSAQCVLVHTSASNWIGEASFLVETAAKRGCLRQLKWFGCDCELTSLAGECRKKALLDRSLTRGGASDTLFLRR